MNFEVADVSDIQRVHTGRPKQSRWGAILDLLDSMEEGKGIVIDQPRNFNNPKEELPNTRVAMSLLVMSKRRGYRVGVLKIADRPGKCFIYRGRPYTDVIR